MEKAFHSMIFITLLAVMTSCSQCTEQHDPSADIKKFSIERENANKKKILLTAEGKIPAKEEPASAVAAATGGEAKYQQFCTPCHGADGAAQGPTAQAMSPKPRDFTEASWQDSVDDERIAKVIKEGGTAVGLSPTMAPWGAMLSSSEVDDMVKLIRSFRK